MAQFNVEIPYPEVLIHVFDQTGKHKDSIKLASVPVPGDTIEMDMEGGSFDAVVLRRRFYRTWEPYGQWLIGCVVEMPNA